MFQKTEQHPLPPFTPENATVLLLGSFPPPKEKWKMDFFYPNFQNDMWRIFGLVFFNNKDYFVNEDKKSFNKELIMEFLTDKGIAVFDTAQEVIRKKGNASDNFLEIITPINLPNVLSKLPQCNTLVTTGEKATETLRLLFSKVPPAPKVGSYVVVDFLYRKYNFYRMPSSSRAYPKPLNEKAAAYARLFNEVGLL